MTDNQKRVLYVTSDDDRMEAMIRTISTQNVQMVFATTAVEGIALLGKESFCAVIAEDKLEDCADGTTKLAHAIAELHDKNQKGLSTFIVDTSTVSKNQATVTKLLKPAKNVAILVADFSRTSTLNFELL